MVGNFIEARMAPPTPVPAAVIRARLP